MEEKEITYGGSKLMAQVLLLVNEDKNYINGKISNEELEDFVKRNNLNDELTYEIYQFLKAKEVKIISNEEKGIEKEFKKFINKKLKKGCILRDDIEDYIYDNDLTDDEVIQIEFYLEDNNIKVIEYDDR